MTTPELERPDNPMRSAAPPENLATTDVPRPKPRPFRALLASRRTHLVLRIGALLVLLALLFRLLDSRTVISALARADLGLVLVGIGLVQAQVLLSALRWKFTAGRLDLHLPLMRATREYYVAVFLNQVLPGGVAGDAVRTYRNRTHDAAGESRWRASLRSVVLERAAGQVAFFVIAIGGLLAWPLLLPASVPEDVEALVAVPVLIFAALAAIVAFAAMRGPKRIRGALTDIGPDIRNVFVRRGAWFYQAGLSLTIVSSYIAVFVVAGAALGVAIPPIGWFTIVPMVLLAMLIPISIGGWGLREGAAAALFPLVGIDASLALAVAILYGLINLAGSLPGLWVFVATRARRIA
ncbi:MAG TPA: lysylphosphatidylglycerol synthase transmembrane domain-containing protein [Saliniramus sp.]|nr:lysylphosphatidylglycerol synthase transmembrane domain-containing protein [Saliniramus sp.]